MSNRILDVKLATRRADAAEAEIWISATVEQKNPTTQLRGRLVGPKCPGVSTVEVAYPLRSFPRPPADLPGLVARVVIPEPNLWEPACPFVYDGVVELWEEGQRRDEFRVEGYKIVTVRSSLSQ